MNAFGVLTHTLIWIFTALNVLLIVAVAMYVLRALEGVVRNVRHQPVTSLPPYLPRE